MRKVRIVWIAFIVIGPLLLFASGAVFMLASRDEWVPQYEESDFHRESGESSYSLLASGSHTDKKMRIIVKENMGRDVPFRFRVVDFFGDEELFNKEGHTPANINFQLESRLLFNEYTFFLDILDDNYTINDLDISIDKLGPGPSSAFFCMGGSVIGLSGIAALVLGIIFTATYSTRIRKMNPEYMREEIVRKQEILLREEEARRAKEVERIRQRQAMILRARDLEKALRLEEAAHMYERLDMWEDAGRCRKKMLENVPGTVPVDANQLFERLKRRGITIPYLCPGCHATFDIDGDTRRYTRCPKCGRDVDFNILQKSAANLLR